MKEQPQNVASGVISGETMGISLQCNFYSPPNHFPTYSDAPQFNNDVTTLAFAVGEKAILNCSVDSNPAATITIVTPSGTTVSLNPDGIFVITNITSDKGTYVCTANNALGNAMLSYTVNVERK